MYFLLFYVFFLYFSDKTLNDFVSEKSKQFLSPLQIDDSFLKEDVSSWAKNAVFLESKSKTRVFESRE